MLARQPPIPPYKGVPIGAGVSDAFGAASTAAAWQFWSYIASMIAQLTTLITGSIAIAQTGNPQVLATVLWLELCVQIVELVWYSAVGIFYVVVRDSSVPVHYRYLDWACKQWPESNPFSPLLARSNLQTHVYPSRVSHNTGHADQHLLLLLVGERQVHDQRQSSERWLARRGIDRDHPV